MPRRTRSPTPPPAGKKANKNNNNNDDGDDLDSFLAEDEEEWIDEEDLFEDDDDDDHENEQSDKKQRKSSGPDLYAVLGVPRDAAETDIARAYRRQALLCHPDRNPDGAETFKKLTAAYEVLSDPNRRKIYDRTGETSEQAAASADFDTDEAARSYEMGEMLKAFMDAFRGSDEEQIELGEAFEQGHGVLDKTLERFMWTNDEGEVDRIVALVNSSVIPNLAQRHAGEDEATRARLIAAWGASSTDAKVAALKKKLDKERVMAEKMLQEFAAARANMNNNNGNGNGNKQQAKAITAKATKKHSGGGGVENAAAAAADNGNNGKNNNKNKNNQQVMVLPSLASLRENAKRNFEDMTESLMAKFGSRKSKAKKEGRKK